MRIQSKVNTTLNEIDAMTHELQPDEDSRMLAIGIGVLFGGEMIVIIAIMLAVGASLRDILLILALVFGLTFGIFFLVTRLMWIPWQHRYPKQPVLLGAVSRSMQSFAFPHLCWFNNCLRISVDEQHLHICPFIFCRPFGAKRLSIPWEAITDVQKTRWPGLFKAKLGGKRIRGPEWCLKLAQAEKEPVSERMGTPHSTN